MIYGYARVSSSDQNLDRQLIQLREYVTDERYIITDKASGKNFDRRGYNSLVGTEEVAPRLQEGDLLVVCSLDRLGRNYTEIQEQWQYITKTLKANIKVLDMPLLDTSTKNSLDGQFIADLVLQILAYVSEKERLHIRARQQQGLQAMPTDENGKRISSKTGKAIGRPTAEYPTDWNEKTALWKSGKITATECMKQLGLKRTTFYKLLKTKNEE